MQTRGFTRQVVNTFGIGDTYSRKSSREYTNGTPVRVTSKGTRSAQPERETRGFLRGRSTARRGTRGRGREYNHLGNPPRCRLFGGGLAPGSPLSALPSPLKLSDFDKVPGVLENPRAVCVSTQNPVCVATSSRYTPLSLPPATPPQPLWTCSLPSGFAMPVTSFLCERRDPDRAPFFSSSSSSSFLFE